MSSQGSGFQEWQCVMQMETGKLVASGTRDMSHHRALGQSLLIGFFGVLLWVGLTHFLETMLEVPP